jgi:hypothetical protein
MAAKERFVTAEWLRPGVVKVTVQVSRYPTVGEHWKRELDGSNAKKWGRIFIDPDPAAKKERRSEALAPTRGIHKGNKGANWDECPGAMFIWESQRTSSVEATDALSNQAFGRDLYHALRRCIIAVVDLNLPTDVKRRMAWWEVQFEFV